MALTKTYRLIWDIETGRLIINPFEVYPAGSSTTVGNGRGYYETNTIENVIEYINENGLIYLPNNI